MKSGILVGKLADKVSEIFKTKRYYINCLDNYINTELAKKSNVNEDMSSIAQTVQSNVSSDKSEGVSFGQVMNNCINYN